LLLDFFGAFGSHAPAAAVNREHMLRAHVKGFESQDALHFGPTDLCFGLGDGQDSAVDGAAASKRKLDGFSNRANLACGGEPFCQTVRRAVKRKELLNGEDSGTQCEERATRLAKIIFEILLERGESHLPAGVYTVELVLPLGAFEKAGID